MESQRRARTVWSLWQCALFAGCILGCTNDAKRAPTTDPALQASTTVSVTVPIAVTSATKHLAGAGGAPSHSTPRVVNHAIVVSVDGLAPRFLDALIKAGKAPTFAALQKRTAWTHDARTDKTYTVTLPNHTSMITGLPVSPTVKYGPHFAHNYVQNVDPLPTDTLHQFRLPAGSYTASMFDVAHDHGLTTAMFASKTKFSLYEQTYNFAGAPDQVGEDNGRRKIDHAVIDVNPATLVRRFVEQLRSSPPALSFVHLNQPDGAGHGVGWGSPAYLTAVQQMDGLLGAIVAAIDEPPLAGHTALLITSDHGGVDNHHADETDIRNFQIPLYLLVPGLPATDAYEVFTQRFNPGKENPAYETEKQPLRNGDVGNLALFLLGLGPIPESTIHTAGLKLE